MTLSQSELSRIGGTRKLEECLTRVVDTRVDNIKHIEKSMQTYHMAESMVEAVKVLPKKDTYDIEEVRQIAEKVQQAAEGVKVKRKNFTDLLHETNLKLMNMTDGMSGVPTGYTSLDSALDGWQEKDLILLGARPSAGKTALTVNFFLQSALEDAVTTYIPAETGDESIIKRSIAVLGGLPVNAMRHPSKYLTKDEMITYNQTLVKLRRLPLHIEELHDIRDIKQLARERRREHPDKRHLFIIDHLGHLCDGQAHTSRNLEFESYCKQLKDIAKEYNIAVMLLSQLSREVEKRPDKRPMLSDLRDSGAIEQIADVIMFIYRGAYYDKTSTDNTMELIIAKNRDGGTGTKYLEFFPTTNRVAEIKE